MDSVEGSNVIENDEQTEINKTQFEYRKIQSILGDVSFSLVLPKSYAVNMGLKKGEFVRVYQQEDKIVIEKA